MSGAPSITPPGAIGGVGLRAWAVVDAAGNVLRGSNVASCTKGAAGQYTVNFTAALANSYGLCDCRPLDNSSAAASAFSLGGLVAGSVAVLTKISGANSDHSFYIGVYW